MTFHISLAMFVMVDLSLLCFADVSLLEMMMSMFRSWSLCPMNVYVVCGDITGRTKCIGDWHCNHINGMGQSILEALQLYTAGRTKCQPQDDKIMIGNRGTCVDGSTQNRDIDATSGSGNY